MGHSGNAKLQSPLVALSVLVDIASPYVVVLTHGIRVESSNAFSTKAITRSTASHLFSEEPKPLGSCPAAASWLGRILNVIHMISATNATEVFRRPIRKSSVACCTYIASRRWLSSFWFKSNLKRILFMWAHRIEE